MSPVSLAGVRSRPAVVLVVLVVAALLGLSVMRGLAWQERLQQRADERAASEAATAQVEKLVSVSGATSEEDMRSLLGGATGDFRTELESQADRLRRALAADNVKATGEVVSTGVVRTGDGRATVLVAATGSVRNKHAESAQPRNYRLSVDLRKVDDSWLVSGLEFVA